MSATCISEIEIFPLHYRLKRYFKYFSTPHGLTARPGIVVKIRAEDGTVGWGQSVPVPTWGYETFETTLIALEQYYRPVLLGLDPSDLDRVSNAMDRVISSGFTTGMPIARAGIDIALHDLNAKRAGKSLAEMWGKQPGGKLELSWTVNVEDLDDVAETLESAKAEGYRDFNVKVGAGLNFDLQLISLIREILPDCGRLWADANCGYEVEEALAAAPKLADAGVELLESPLPPNRIRGYRELKAQGALQIFMDEGIVTPVELEEFIALDMLDGVAMKPARCGGLKSCREQIELIERHNLAWVGSGLCDPDISLAATLALYGAYGLKRPAAVNGPQFLEGSILRNPIQVKQGVASIPNGLGLGVEVDEAKLARAVEIGHP